MKKFLAAVGGYLLFKAIGLVGLLAMLFFIWMHNWAKSHSTWRWPSLLATFAAGVAVFFPVAFVALGPDGDVTASTLRENNYGLYLTMIVCTLLMLGSLILAGVYGWQAAAVRLRRTS
ncbi:hypothetical protein [Melittangium boletus]|uniref:hypothetical protein n=1 Tax=Melittangium boletus TaxID=83453 RepID=UPI003DA3CECD